MAPAEVYILSHNQGEDRDIGARGRKQFNCGTLAISVDARSEGLTEIVIDKTEHVSAYLRDSNGQLLTSIDSMKEKSRIALLENTHTLQLQGGAGSIYIRHGINRKKQIPIVSPERKHLQPKRLFPRSR